MTQPAMPNKRVRIGEVLLEEGTITQEQLKKALSQQKETGRMLGEVLVESGVIEASVLVQALARRLGFPGCHLRHGLIDPALLKLIGEEEGTRLKAIPLFKVRDTLTVAMAEPQSLPKIDRLRQLTGCKIRPVLALGSNDALLGAGARTVVGRQIGEHYGFVYDGIFQSQDEINNHATQFGAVLKPGDVKYKDISGPNGKPDGVVDEAYDRTYLGSGIPKYNYGLSFSASYKGFDIGVFASGSAKFLINSRMYRDLHHSAGALNYSTDMLNRWTPTHTNTDIPRLNDDDVNNGKDSNRPGWLQNGTYLRINTVSLGYTLKEGFIKGFASARIYATAQNLYSFQGYQGYNPDFTAATLSPGFDFGSYPKPRTILVGVQVSF